MADVKQGTAIPEVLSESVLSGADVESYDVVVVGFGIAGGCAALEAARAGAKVLLLERASVHGGTSSMSGGHFYLGGGTAVQHATGHEDSAEEMYAYLMAAAKDPDADKVRAYCDDSVEHFTWLEALGFEFERSYYPHKAVIQPGTQGLMFTGNEKVWPYRDLARPAPRGHKVPVPGDTEGTRIVMDLLRERIEEAGVEVRYETGATNLVATTVAEEGRQTLSPVVEEGRQTLSPVVEEGRQARLETIVGVAWRNFDTHGVVAASSVVLAAGGFVMNPDMVAEHTPALGEKLFTLGSTYDDGLGLRLGLSAGVELQHMEEPFITAPVYPPASLVSGLVVNVEGQRFVAEDSYHSRTSQFVMEQTGSAAYLIVDSEHVEYPDMPLVPLLDGFETVAEMAAGLGIDETALSETLTRYNTMAEAGTDEDFHKAPEWLASQHVAPWAVFDMRLGHALYAGFTLGGMRVSVDGEAQRADGSVIPGLYAAGACASNLAQDGKSYCSGTQLGEGSYFGRRAGRHAASVAG